MFLHGFLHSDNWSIRTIENLRPIFVEGIGDLAREHRRYFDEEGQSARFLRSLAAGWLNDVEGFDELLEVFLCIASDTERATFVKELQHQFRFDPAGGNVDLPGTLTKRDSYWQRRVEELSTSLPAAERSEELGAFCFWPVRYHQGLRELEPRLAAAIDHLADGFHTAKILESIAARAELVPLPALRLLNRLAERLYTDRDLQLWAASRELEAALEAVCSGAKRHHRPLIRQLANHLIRGGLVDYAQRVEQCGK